MQNTARAVFEIFLWWTHGESNSKLIHAMDAYYHYTMGPCCALGIVYQNYLKSPDCCTGYLVCTAFVEVCCND